MANELIIQSSLFVDFLLPFLFVWTVVFAILQKTKLLGDGKTQIDAIVSAVIGLIFIGFVGPKQLVGNMLMFFSVAMTIIFVLLLLWGFATGGDFSKPFTSKGVNWFFGILIGLSVLSALLYFTGYNAILSNFLYSQNWSSPLWSNVFLIIIVAGVIAFVLKTAKK
jgi:hypothetical protein